MPKEECRLSLRIQWYELNRASNPSGIVVAFRRKDNVQERTTVELSGLEAESNYKIINLADNSVVTKTGREMMDGLELKMDAPKSLVLKYTKK